MNNWFLWSFQMLWWLILPIKFLCNSLSKLYFAWLIAAYNWNPSICILSTWISLTLFIHLQRRDCLGFSQHKIHLGWFLWIGLRKHQLLLLVALKSLLLLIAMLFLLNLFVLIVGIRCAIVHHCTDISMKNSSMCRLFSMGPNVMRLCSACY